jgi:GNAT superfamily N-acetyltransferase
MTLDIAYLADAPHHLPELARWLHAEWGYLVPGSTVETQVERLRPRLQRRAVPCAFVALHDGRLAGSASLVERDSLGHPEWSPWLAGVYVHADLRGHGIASALVERVADEARALGFPTLYLHATERRSLYARLGWRVEYEREFRGLPVAVMSRALGG